MNTEAYREFQLLTEISSGDSVTQRHLAKKYGLALGLTNFLIRRLVNKGHVKMINLQRKRLRYLVTPTGLAEKARLTYEYLDYSLALYRHIRTLLTHTLQVIHASGGTRVVVYGAGELAEITFLLLQQHGLTVAAVVEDEGREERLFNQPVRPLAALATLTWDCIVVASFKDRDTILQRLGRIGVPPERILTISDRSPAALHPDAAALPLAPATGQEALIP